MRWGFSGPINYKVAGLLYLTDDGVTILFSLNGLVD